MLRALCDEVRTAHAGLPDPRLTVSPPAAKRWECDCLLAWPCIGIAWLAQLASVGTLGHSSWFPVILAACFAALAFYSEIHFEFGVLPSRRRTLRTEARVPAPPAMREQVAVVLERLELMEPLAAALETSRPPWVVAALCRLVRAERQRETPADFSRGPAFFCSVEV